MDNDFKRKLSLALKQNGYLVENKPSIVGVQSFLYAHSPKRFQLGFAKVEDHFLFVEWGPSAYSRLEQLLEGYKAFQVCANQALTVPHALRLTIPNLALVAVSCTGFSSEIIQFVRSTYLTPWYGGEVGQVLLVDLEQQQVIYHIPPGPRRYPIPGALPLNHAVAVLQPLCQQAVIVS